MKNKYLVIQCMLLSVFIVSSLNCQNSGGSVSEITIDGSIRYIYKEDNYLFVGYRDDEYGLNIAKIEIIQGKLEFKDKIEDKALFYKYRELEKIKQESYNSKYQTMIESDKKERKCEIQYDETKFDSHPFIDFLMVKESPDKKQLLLLYTCEDGRSFFASQFVIVNIERNEVNSFYLEKKDDMLKKFTKNFEWISENIICFDVCSIDGHDIVKTMLLE